eukprot:INCI16055.1.p1 GENE.INCI16055.1~~INCI16055.1.p1  ORF type:complete len:149 (-),score=17.19 INCI16055.1:293-739(-)
MQLVHQSDDVKHKARLCEAFYANGPVYFNVSRGLDSGFPNVLRSPGPQFSLRGAIKRIEQSDAGLTVFYFSIPEAQRLQHVEFSSSRTSGGRFVAIANDPVSIGKGEAEFLQGPVDERSARWALSCTPRFTVLNEPLSTHESNASTSG